MTLEQPSKIRQSGKTLYAYKNHCGNYVGHKGSLCRTCYQKKVTSKPLPPKKHKYFCSCGKPIQARNKIYRECYLKLAQVNAERKQLEINKRHKQNDLRQTEKLKSKENPVCSNSPDKKHYEIINSQNIGICKYCGRTKNYTILQQEFMKSL